MDRTWMRHADDGRLKFLNILFPVALLLFCFPPTESAAQPLTLYIDHVDVSAFPQVGVAFRVMDSTQQLTNISTNNFIVTENGITVPVLSVTCAADSIRPPLSIMLTMDKSLSMVRHPDLTQDPDSLKFRAAKQTFGEFIKSLRPQDEAALLGFAGPSFVDVHQYFTSNQDSLLRALSNVTVASGTAIYDAIVDGILLLSKRPNKRIMILLTDGNDTQSWNTITYAINAARNARIPVYTIGLGGDVDSLKLKQIASETGGEYFFAPSPSELLKMYQKLMSTIFNSACVLAYESPAYCPDGGKRTVTLRFSRGNRSIAQTFSYTAPLRRETMAVTLDPTLDMVTQSTIRFPLYYRSTVDSARPVSFTVTYSFDDSKMEFIGIDSSESILENVPHSLSTTASSVTITISNQKISGYVANTTEVLCRLRFSARPQSKIVEATPSTVVTQFKERDCEGDASGGIQTITIRGCPEFVALEFDSLSVVKSNGVIDVPLRLKSALDVKQAVTIDMTFTFDTSRFEFISMVRSPVLVADTMQLQQTPDGTVHFIVTNARLKDTTGVLISARLHAKKTKQSTVSQLHIDAVTVQQLCTPKAFTKDAKILIDGDCGKIAVFEGYVELHQNVPNPGNPMTRISFTLDRAQSVTLRVHDRFGRSIETLVEGFCAASTHHYPLNTTMLSSGVYYYTLTGDSWRRTRNMLVVK